jgi:plastocyanin
MKIQMKHPLLMIPGCILAAALGMAVAAERASADAPMQMHGMMMPASAPSGPPVNTNSVAIRNFAFSPAVITVAAGTTVTWANQDNDPHTVVLVDHSYRSTPMDTGDHVTHTFATPGQYRYFCGLHPQMTGIVIVRGANG